MNQSNNILQELSPLSVLQNSYPEQGHFTSEETSEAIGIFCNFFVFSQGLKYWCGTKFGKRMIKFLSKKRFTGKRKFVFFSQEPTETIANSPSFHFLLWGKVMEEENIYTFTECLFCDVLCSVDKVDQELPRFVHLGLMCDKCYKMYF